MSRFPVTQHRRALVAVFVAGGVSSFGTQMTALALPWLVLQSTGSATQTGLVFAVEVLPMALLGLHGGEVLQRLGARLTMLIGDFARAPIVAAVPVLAACHLLSLPALLGAVALLGVFGVPYPASQQVLATELIGPDPRALTWGNSIIEGVYNAAAFGGPAVAGALISFLGAQQVLWIDAVSYLASWLLLALFVPRTPAEERAVARVRAPRGLLAGFRRLRADPFLGRTALSTVTYGFLLRILAIALPLLAFRTFHGNAGLGGLLVAGSGAGALAGSLLTYLVAGRISPKRLVGASTVLIAVPLWLLVLPVSPAVLVVAVALSSAAVPVSNAPYFALLSLRVPAGFRPKVLQAVITLSNIAGPLGFLCSGVLMDRVGVRSTLLVVAVLATLATANFLIALRQLGTDPAPAEDATAPAEDTAEPVAEPATAD